MTLTLKSLGAALISAGLMVAAQAAPVALSAVINFDGLTPGTNPPPPAVGTAGDVVTTQYIGFGLEFTENNEVRCSQTTNPICTAARLFPPPPNAARSPNFLMNSMVGAGFSIKVLNGFALNRLTLDFAANLNPFFIKFFDAGDHQVVGSGLDLQFGTNSAWRTEVLGSVNSAVRRIEFGGINTSFAIDDLRFDYVVDSSNVPEPSVLGLVSLALAGVGLAQRRKG